MQTDQETDEVTPPPPVDQPTDQDMDQDGEGEKFKKIIGLRTQHGALKKRVTMSKLKMTMTVKRYMTTQGK